MLKKYRTIIPVAIIAISFAMTLSQSIPKVIPVVMMAIAAILLIYTSRGTLYFSKASKALNKKEEGSMEKAIALYEKAYNAGLPYQYLFVIGTIFLQHGDIEKGKQALIDATKATDKKLAFQATEALSMYYWIKKDLDKAIELCIMARDMNLRDKNLYINLGSYYLAKGDTKEFKHVLKEAFKYKQESSALIDMQAQCLMLTGDWHRAGNFLHTLFTQTTPAYIDPYIHFAYVYMHYGDVDMARKYLSDCLEKASFSNMSLYSKEDIEEMIAALDNEKTRWAFVDNATANVLASFNGVMPSYNREITKPEFEALPTFTLEGKMQEEINEKAENEPDTSLNEEDEIWLQNHQD